MGTVISFRMMTSPPPTPYTLHSRKDSVCLLVNAALLMSPRRHAEPREASCPFFASLSLSNSPFHCHSFFQSQSLWLLYWYVTTDAGFVFLSTRVGQRNDSVLWKRVNCVSRTDSESANRPLLLTRVNPFIKQRQSNKLQPIWTLP